MKIGIVFPQTEFNGDPAAIRDFVQTAEDLGYTHILAYDHILGANPVRPGGWSGPYTHRDPFYEPFLLFSYMAALTHTLEFVTGIIILPQRETVLAAKQAATLDVLCDGRLRLGVATGWNKVEYVAMNQDFHTRGKRLDAQVALMRRLWTEPLVTVDDGWHTIDDAGINPLPVQRPIPIWFGGHADAVLRRVAATGDGWLPNIRTGGKPPVRWRSWTRIWLKPVAGRHRHRTAHRLRRRRPDRWACIVAGWRDAGDHMTMHTMRVGLATPGEHLEAMRTFAAAIGLAR
ncbi:MAG: TIGR03619 family F420-dependent LLM class oxidoreductase [Caldilineaceae bacterium]